MAVVEQGAPHRLAGLPADSPVQRPLRPRRKLAGDASGAERQQKSGNGSAQNSARDTPSAPESEMAPWRRMRPVSPVNSTTVEACPPRVRPPSRISGSTIADLAIHLRPQSSTNPCPKRVGAGSGDRAAPRPAIRLRRRGRQGPAQSLPLPVLAVTFSGTLGAGRRHHQRKRAPARISRASVKKSLGGCCVQGRQP